jgi:hypothetical protein
MTSQTLYATAASGQSDGAAGFSANPATIVIGGAAPNKHALLRFDTSGTPTTETIVDANFTVKVQAKGAGTVPDIGAWASDFGAAITDADYGQAENVLPASGLTGIRAFLDRVLLGTAALNATGTIAIPTQYIRHGVGGVFDIELRPYVGSYTGPSVGATDTLTIYGPATGTAADKPTLTVLSYTDAEIAADEDVYRVAGIGAEAYVAFDIETTRGTPVKGKYLIDMTGSDLDAEAQTILSQSMRRERSAPVKVALGRAGARGSVSMEATPERMWKLLLGFLKLTATTSLGSIAGNDGNNYTCYKNDFKIATNREVKTFTFIQKAAESFRFVYPGCMLDTFSITTGVDRAVDVTVGLLARDEWMYDTPSSGLNDSYLLDPNQGYDLNTHLSYNGVEISKGGVVNNGLIQNVTINMNNNARERVGLRRKRGVRSHYVQKLMCAIDFTMEFKDESEWKKFLGVKHRDFPIKAEMSIQFDDVHVKFGGPLGYQVQEIDFYMPRTVYTVIRKPIQGSEIVMLSCSAMGTFSQTDGTNVMVSATSTEAGTTYVASTNKITVQPINR